MFQIFKTIENKEPFSVNINFTDTRLILNIFQNQNTYKVDISFDSLKEYADKFELDLEEYLSKLKLYLLETPKHVELSFNIGEFICYSITQNDMKIKYFFKKATKVDNNFIQLLEQYSSENHKLRNDNKAIRIERDQAKDVQIQLENKLTELVNRKLEDEEELYSNFVLVLNEKKRRIQHLNQLLQAFKAGRPVLNPVIKKKVKPKETKVEIKNEVSESESDSDNSEYNTDEEMVIEEIKTEELLPSTSKKQHESLLMDINDDEPTSSLPKRSKINNMSNNENEKITKSVSKVDIDQREEINNKKIEEDSPTVEYNTQDLLDCIN